MSITGILLGLITIVIYIAVLVLVGVIAQWILTVCGFPPPDMVRKIFMLIVGLIALYMIVALLLGLPVPRLAIAR